MTLLFDNLRLLNLRFLFDVFSERVNYVKQVVIIFSIFLGHVEAITSLSISVPTTTILSAAVRRHCAIGACSVLHQILLLLVPHFHSFFL